MSHPEHFLHLEKRLKSFSGRLTRTVVLAVFFTMSIVALLAFLITSSTMFGSARLHFEEVLERTSLILETQMNKVEVSASNMKDEINWHLTAPDVVEYKLKQELETNDYLLGCGVAFLEDFFPQQGKWFELYASFEGDSILVKNIGSASHDYYSTEWFKLGLSSPDGAWSNPYLDDAGAGEVLCTYTFPIYQLPENRLAGVLGVDISLREFQEIVDGFEFSQNGPADKRSSKDGGDQRIYSFVLGSNGAYIVHPDKDRILTDSFFDLVNEKKPRNYQALGNAMMAGKTGSMLVNMDGFRSYVYYAPLLDSGWSMGIVVPAKNLFRRAFLYGGLMLFLILLGVFIVFIVCQKRIRKVSEPLIKLAESAEEVAKGNFETELPLINSDDEIRLLRDSFENMQTSLSRYVKDLTETTAQKASMENELYLAREIQMSIIPKKWPAFPERDDIDIYGGVSPAKVVGGDLFDFYIRDGKLFFCIGDVSGKGVPASLVMMLCCAMFRMVSFSVDKPDKILSSMNATMAAQNENMMFVTLFVGVLDLASGQLLYSNAGHNAPVLIKDGIPQFLHADANLAIGILPDHVYSLQQAWLKPGSVLFLYTDGLTEATDDTWALFGEERMIENLSGSRGDAPAEDLVAHMTDSVAKFVGDAEQSDDLTMLAIKITK